MILWGRVSGSGNTLFMMQRVMGSNTGHVKYPARLEVKEKSTLPYNALHST